MTNVEVIGTLTDDHAFNVHFENRNEGFDGVPKKWTRSEDGEWLEEETPLPSEPKRPWWKFW